MIRWIVESSLRFRGLVVAVAAIAMALGIVQLRDAPVDVLPEFTPPYVEIQTEALGLSAEEVEQLITAPMEADLLNGVEGIDVLRSQSVPGASSIVLVFEPGADLYRSRALVQERLTQLGAAAVPNISKPPVMLQPYSSSSRVLMVGLSSAELSPIEMSVISRWTIQPRLLGVPGVANVAIWGFRDRQLQVQVDPERMRANGVTLSQVVETTANAQIATPLSFVEGATPGTGGFIETPQQRLGVRHIFDRLRNPTELAKVPVEGTAGTLALGDVAEVVEDHQPLIGDAVVNDADGVLLVIEKFPGANTLEVTRGIEQALDELRPGLGGMQTDTSLFRPATLIENTIDNLALALIVVAVLVALALAAFLFQWRTVLIAVFTIPLSLVVAGLVLRVLDETINAIALAGLAVALAVVIDEAVVGTENVARRLREARAARSDASTSKIVLDASVEVRSPLVYATLIALFAIAPVAVMSGRPGEFFQPLVVAYALAVAAAMAVALTVTPALSLLLFSRGSAGKGDSPLLGFLRPHYGRALAWLVGRPRAALLAAGACLAVAVVAFAVLPLAGTSLIPSFKDQNVLVRLNAEPGTSNPRMTEITAQLSRELRAIPGVENVGAHVGRAVGGDRIVDVNSSDVWVSIAADADYDATVAAVEDAAERVREARSDVVTYSQQKIRDVGALREGENPVTGDGLDVLTGTGKPLAVRVYGQDLEILHREASKVRELMSEVEGVVDPRVEEPVVQPNVEIEIDLDKAGQLGIKPGDIRRAQGTLVQGLHVGSVFEEQKVFDVVVQGSPQTRQSVANIANLPLDGPAGTRVRLGEVADVRIEQAPIAISRDAVSRYLDVEAAVSGRSLDSVVNALEERLATVSFPLEYRAEVLAQTTGREIGTTRMLAVGIAAAIAMFLLLQAALNWRPALLAFVTLPAALAGGAIAALVDGGEISLGALMGFLALFAIAARNALLLMRHFQDLERSEGEPFGPRLIQRGARERLGPILTTAAALALVALVFIVLGTRPGLEVVNSMAIVLLGGLVTTTLMSLFVLPALYLRFAGGRETIFELEDELDQALVPRGLALEGGRSGNGEMADPSGDDGHSEPPRERALD